MWNSLQRSYPGGLALVAGLAHDKVHRRNTRVVLKDKRPTRFSLSTQGSHHTRLVSNLATQWNLVIQTHNAKEGNITLKYHAELRPAASGEVFGLVSYEQAHVIRGATIKEEEDEADQELRLLDDDPALLGNLMQDLNIDPSLLTATATQIPPAESIPTIAASAPSSSSSLVTNTPITLKRKLSIANADAKMNDQLLLMPATIKPYSSAAASSTKKMCLDATEVSIHILESVN